MNLQAYLVLLLGIACGVSGQLLLKQGMARRPDFRLGNLLALARDPRILGGFGCYGISVLFYFKALSALELSLAYPTVSFGYVLTIVLSRVLFKEPVGAARWLAVAIICMGVALVGLGAA